jgi:hypothetical protein
VQVVKVAQPAAWQLRRQAAVSATPKRRRNQETPVGG